MDTPSLLTHDRFACLMAPFQDLIASRPMAVAVSGGCDSVCLAFFLKKWCKDRGIPLFPMIVDHGMRPESSKEALQVKQQLESWGMETLLLSLNLTKKNEEEARIERYRALSLACFNRQIPILLTAHHGDDNLETFLMRLTRGSGPYGLGSMDAREVRHGLFLLRPFLFLERQMLEQTLGSLGVYWIEDPSNDWPHILRNRVRRLCRQFSRPEKIVLEEKALIFRRYRQDQDRRVRSLLACFAQPFEWGMRLNWSSVYDQEPRFLRLLFQKLHFLVRGEYRHPLSISSLDRLNQVLGTSPLSRFTLGGVIFHRMQETVYLYREGGRIRDVRHLEPGEHTLLWDGRFYISIHVKAPIVLRPLGRKEGGSPLQKNFWESLPSLWQGERLMAAPPLTVGDAVPPVSSSVLFHFASLLKRHWSMVTSEDLGREWA